MIFMNLADGVEMDAAGVAVPNEALSGSLTSPAGAYLVDTVNFELDGSPVDVTDIEGTLITSFAPSVFPGVPGNGSHTDNFAVEVVGFLKLPAGVTTFGVSVGADRTDVNNDDSRIALSGLQTLKKMHEAKLAQLADTIKAQGFLQRLLVRPWPMMANVQQQALRPFSIVSAFMVARRGWIVRMP
jgi:hypothetical protein